MAVPENKKKVSILSSIMKYDSEYCYFESDEDRNVAFMNWKEQYFIDCTVHTLYHLWQLHVEIDFSLK